MRAGNARYLTERDFPETVPLFPLAGALLLPGGRLPLNIFEPRYLEMFDAAIGGDRLVGMVQPRLNGELRSDGEPELCAIGGLGRITSFSEAGDGRYLISLQGICRFRIQSEITSRSPYRQAHILPFLGDLDMEEGAAEVDRTGLLRVFRAYLDANGLDADWDSVARAENATLVNALSMMAPYGPAEKQALLEAPDLKTRAETLIAITEMELAGGDGDGGARLQ
jgi:Lon protease-like protein